MFDVVNFLLFLHSNPFLFSVLLAIYVYILGKFLLKIADLFLVKQLKKKMNEKDFLLFKQVFHYVIWIIAFIAYVVIIYRDFGGLLTAIGLIGAGLTIALQKPISNFAAWSLIIVSRPFTIGDRIYARENKGDVIEITPMRVVLREIDDKDEPTGRVVILPPDFVFNSPIVNYSKGSDDVWKFVSVDFTYESNINKAIEIVVKSIEEVIGHYMEERFKSWKKRNFELEKNISPKPRIVIEFKDSSINVRGYYFHDFRLFRPNAVKAKILKKILEKVAKEEDVDIAYPHLVILSGDNKEKTQKEE